MIGAIIISTAAYFGVAVALIYLGKPRKPPPRQKGPAFDELYGEYEGLPELEQFTGRDGAVLSYRYYPAPSDRVLILLHGSGWHSRYFLPLARFISDAGLAQVYTPDLRGHGKSPKIRGDVDYIGQLEEDLAIFIAGIQKENPAETVILGGHSSGGGLAVRFSGSPYRHLVDAYLLLSPFLKYNAPTMRPSSGGWARPYTGRIIGLTLLNNLGIRWFNHLPVIDFNMPQEARDGTETLTYSYRLNTAYAPRNYRKDLTRIFQPLLVVVGKADEAFLPDAFEAAISPFVKAQVTLLENVTHMGVVVGPEVRPVIAKWLQGFPGNH
jgi:non-heme chloroperoxidase